ncbi:TolC family protein [Rufibacter sediminis]|uniref:TolC family protein n=1 Tax=Rufibacter sediminis TaxID=2762756 RepID=A0ABR6VNR7_9BACT|nr:TolC family protein [Rufibacter sediminis]MBC3538552.1 TolC family protein [Rufibacter sediminis]
MKKLSLALLMAFYGLVASAQTAPAKEAEWEKKLFNSEYALPILIETAITNSIELENAEAAKLAAIEQRKIVRKNFYSGFSINSSYTYGSMNNWSTNGEPVNSFNAFDAPLRARYNAGFSMSLPLGQLLSRHNTIKNQDLAIAQVEGSKKLAERAVRMRVITLYQNLVLAKSQLELQQEAYQTAVVSLQLAKRQFKSGEILIDAMSNVQQAYTSTATALQTAKVNYETQLLMMEETIGTRLIDLIQSK